MQRTVILIDFYWTRDKDPRVPLGHASILATLAELPDIDVRPHAIAVNLRKDRPADIAKLIMEDVGDRPHHTVDIALGAYVWGEDLLRGAIRQLRRRGFEGRIILGGPQVSYAPDGLEALYPEADAFIRGYGEQALAQLVSSHERRPISGVHWAGTIDLRTQANVDLNSLPSPWLSGTIPLEGQRFIRWETQRGCQFRCAFCQHREAGSRLSRRTLNSERVRAEIDLFCESNVEEIAVLDPIFNLGNDSVQILERFVRKEFKGRLSLQCRAETIKDEFIEAVSELDACLEFGLQTVHEDEWRAVRRRNNLPAVDNALQKVREHRIDHEVSLIFGLPMQSLASFEESVSWCLERNVPVIKAFPLMLLRGTELDQDRDRWGLVDTGGSMPMVIEADSFGRADWYRMAQLSEALKQTEGQHPESIERLKQVAQTTTPEIARWMPETVKNSA
jgi:radical SAM superfamily enzyme YgiQ (UPF0313 family)